MQVAHLIFNIIYIYFAYISIRILITRKETQTKFKKSLMRVCFVFGVIGYIFYLALIISSIGEGNLFDGSFAVLMTSWAFMFAIERIDNKK